MVKASAVVVDGEFVEGGESRAEVRNMRMRAHGPSADVGGFLGAMLGGALGAALSPSRAPASDDRIPRAIAELEVLQRSLSPYCGPWNHVQRILAILRGR